MDEISFRHDEPPARLIAMQIYQESFMKKKKWRHVAGALIESSKHGRARLEIFNTEDELKVARPSKIVLLDDCLSIRVVDLQDDANRHLKLHLRDGSSVALRADNVFALRTQLSRLAFPTQFVSLNRPFSLDSPSTPPDIIPTENSLPVPVLLLQTVGSLHEGSYGLLFGEEKIELRTEDRTAGSFDYENIHWIASGDYCFGFETNRTSLLYEFKCTQPQQIIDSYRKKCKFRSYFHPTSRPTVNHYLRFYYPDTLRSGESTLSSDSKNVPSSSASSSAPRPMLRESAASPESEDIPLHQIRNVRFAPVITTEINSKPKNKIKVKNETPKLATIIRYNPDTRSPRVGSSHSVERPRDMPLESIQRPDGSGVEPVYSPIPLAIASSPLDPSIQTLVSHLAPASRVSLASATPTADAARVSRVEILQSTYID